MGFDFNFDAEKVASNPLAVSAIGSILGLKAVPGASWGERALNAMVMFGCGVVLGAGLVEYLGVTNKKVGAGVVLLTAALSLVLFQMVVAAIKATNLGQLVNEWARKKMGLDKPADNQGG